MARALALLGALAAGQALAQSHMVPLFPAASAGDAGPQGFVRIINHSPTPGDVRVLAIDDAGMAADAAQLAIGAGAVVHFNSTHLRDGNPAIGLEGIGRPSAGSENWRLQITSELDVEVLAYLRTADGFLTAMHDVVPSDGSARQIAFFNPARNRNQVSLLRLVNYGSEPAGATIAGTDDQGRVSGGVQVTVPPLAARTYSAADLENGHGELQEALGAGSGKWRLTVTSAGDLSAMSLLRSPTGHLTNLSSVGPSPQREGDMAVHRVAYFPAGGQARQGFLRLVNPGNAAATVDILAVDALAQRGRPITLRIDAGRAVHFNSEHLEQGNPAIGLEPGVGTGSGPWRLELRTTDTLQVLAYIRTEDGFLTSMVDAAPVAASQHRVAIFNPGRNANQVSQLHLTNSSGEAAAIAVRGIDDRGRMGGTVRLTLPPGGMRTLTAQALERGTGLAGALGEGAGKWRLTVQADRPVRVASLLASPTGHLTNLSSAADRSASTFFATRIVEPVVEAKCINCHISGGFAQNTRLIFESWPSPDADDLHETFRGFVAAVAGADARILQKVQGNLEHGGGIQVAADSEDFANLRTYLARLVSERQTSLPLPQPVAVPLVDAIPSPALTIDASTRSLHLVHTEAAGAAAAASYGYGGQCQPSGYTLRRSLEDLSPGQASVLASHRLRCQLVAMGSYRVWADALEADGSFRQATLEFVTGPDQGPPALTVRDATTIPQANVDDLFEIYLLEAILDDLSPSLQLAVGVLIEQTAERTWPHLRDPDPLFDVVTESVAYVSRDPAGGRSDLLTGLVARPALDAAASFTPRSRVLLLSHATGSTPSEMSLADAWYAIAAMFAGRGYLVIAPDNWGRGELAPDDQPETYLMASRTANNSLDLLAAVLADARYGHLHAPSAGKTDVSFIGYSQGGHTAVALWLASLGSEHPWRVREIHSGGAPHDLYRTLRGALEHLAGRCDGNDWCRNVGTEVVLPYAAGRILPSILAYTATGLASSDILEDGALKPEFLDSFLGDDPAYDPLKITLQRNGFTNLLGLDRFANAETAIHLYHSPHDHLVPARNTEALATLLAPDFDVRFDRGECASDVYEALRAAVDRVGFIHALCGMEMLDDVMRDLR